MVNALCRWFHRGPQEFNLAVIYIGQNPHSFRCPECSHVWRMQGLKWQLIQRLSASPTWDALAAQYRYVMFADDDLIMQAEDLNIVFRIMAQVRPPKVTRGLGCLLPIVPWAYLSSCKWRLLWM